MPSSSLARSLTSEKPFFSIRLRASPMVKLLAPFAGAGALALVVATAWLLFPEAVAAASRSLPAVVPLPLAVSAGRTAGSAGGMGAVVVGAPPAVPDPWVVCPRLVPPANRSPAAAERDRLHAIPPRCFHRRNWSRTLT